MSLYASWAGWGGVWIRSVATSANIVLQISPTYYTLNIIYKYNFLKSALEIK